MFNGENKPQNPNRTLTTTPDTIINKKNILRQNNLLAALLATMREPIPHVFCIGLIGAVVALLLLHFACAMPMVSALVISLAISGVAVCGGIGAGLIACFYDFSRDPSGSSSTAKVSTNKDPITTHSGDFQEKTEKNLGSNHDNDDNDDHDYQNGRPNDGIMLFSYC